MSVAVARKMVSAISAASLCLAGALPVRAEAVAAARGGQIRVECIERSPNLPEPLVMRDWKQVAKKYYRFVFDRKLKGKNLPVLGLSADGRRFGFGDYVRGAPPASGESMSCLSAVIGGKLVGLEMRELDGFDFARACQEWYDPKLGLYRNRPTDRGGVVHSGVYGYWPVILSLELAHLYPELDGMREQLRSTVRRFHELARGMGAPDRPDFGNFGYDFGAGRPGGRKEPMNRLGNASTVAWINYVGWSVFGDKECLADAEAAVRWHLANPGRYEVTHLPGPVTVARINAELGRDYDLGKMIRIWFGDFDERCPWKATTGTRHGGMTTDGLHGAWRGGKARDFHAFAMGSLQGPAWLVPVARYDARCARAVGKYALHAANSMRLLQGYGLDWDHQDHKDWKDRYDPDCVLFYEALVSRDWGRRGIRPYATGDPVRLGWGVPKAEAKVYHDEKRRWFAADSCNLSLYMGNHVGLLGGIVERTDVDGILRWDCIATDWFAAPAHPTYLLYNPHGNEKRVALDVGPERKSIYDLATHRFVERRVRRRVMISLPADSAVVLAIVPADARPVVKGGRLSIEGKVVDYAAP
ncbi:MAG: hypothetical protein ACYTFI_04725 [Planctomycetota bacterium]|jgi:hypothetical protein